MSYTADTYSAILDDIKRGGYTPGSSASRLKEYANGVAVVFSVDIMTLRRELFVQLDEPSEGIQFPKWKGIAIDIAQLPDYGNNQYYVRFIQLQDSENYIFEIVIEDLRQAVEMAETKSSVLVTIMAILTKWKKFFQSEKSLLLSDELQEGLFGELTFLRLMIKNTGSSAVRNWVGGERETHDFYFMQNAVEVKTSVRKEPYFFRITNEYQLDDTDVSGRLYLYTLALRKSKQSGIKIPELIQQVREDLMQDQTMLSMLNEKLIAYGYIEEAAELYTLGFTIRDHFVYEIKDSFPRIIRSMIPSGVSSVNYEILESQCMPYVLSEDALIQILKGGNGHA